MQQRELDVTADFPEEMQRFGMPYVDVMKCALTCAAAVLQRVEEYNALRQRMTADMADSVAQVKAIVIRAEDSRMIADMYVYTTPASHQ